MRATNPWYFPYLLLKYVSNMVPRTKSRDPGPDCKILLDQPLHKLPVPISASRIKDLWQALLMLCP